VIYYFHSLDVPALPDGDIREKRPVRSNTGTEESAHQAANGPSDGMEGESAKMNSSKRQSTSKESSFGDKLLRSAQQARDWVNGKPVRARVTYVPIPQIDVRKLRSRMKLSQTQFAAKFGFSLDSIQNWEQGHRQPEGPARVLLAVIAKNPKAVEEAIRS
jgi:putative transcriptional regulator